MTDGRLPAGVEASALLRRAQAEGGFGTILAKGDPDRGSILLILLGRGTFYGCFERLLSPDGRYDWTRSGLEFEQETPEFREFLTRRRQRDPDQWQIELDIDNPERFVAEMTEIS